MSNYATKAYRKKARGVDTSKFTKKIDLANLKSNVEKLDIDKLKNVPINLSNFKSQIDKLDVDKLAPVNLKSKVDKLDVDKLAPVPVDLSKQVMQ